MVSQRESLLSPSAVKMYGRVIAGLSIDIADVRDELGANQFLRRQLEPGTDPKLAQIYGYSYFGHYQALARPTIFLVHGDGTPASPRVTALIIKEDGKDATFTIRTPVAGKLDDPPFSDPKNVARFGSGTVSVDISGQAAPCGDFAFDIRIWEYDRGDFSLRLDIDSGPLERIPGRARGWRRGPDALLRQPNRAPPGARRVATPRFRFSRCPARLEVERLVGGLGRAQGVRRRRAACARSCGRRRG